MAKVLITGATGFIGQNLVQKCLEQGDYIKILVLPDDPKKEDLKAFNVELIEGDIRNFKDVKRACKDVQKIFHCAGIVTDWAPRHLYDEVNIQGMENICQAAIEEDGIERFVYMSTCDVFGPIEGEVIDESFPLMKWGEPYPDTKIESEKIAWKYYHEHNLPITMVYGLWVYGEGDYTFTALLADAIVKKELIFWRKNVHVWPVYIENLTDFLYLISEDPRAIGNGYFIHDGKMTTLQEYCKIIAQSLDREPIDKYIPYWLAKTAAWIMEKWWKLWKKKTRPLLTTYIVTNLGSRFEFSMNKAQTQLKWIPPYSFEEGMAKTMEWLKTVDLEQLKQK